MIYKWSTETFTKTEVQADGEKHTYNGERYWIDVIDVKNFKVDVVLTKRQRDSEKPEVICALRVNESKLMEWYADTIEEAASIGEKLIQEIKADVTSIT